MFTIWHMKRMEIAAEVKAVADSMELLEKLFSSMVGDMNTGTVFPSQLKSTKKKHLDGIWYGMDFRLDIVNGPNGYPDLYDAETLVNWECCMKSYAQMLGDNGCVNVTFTTVDMPDSYRVEMCTTGDGDYLIFDIINEDCKMLARELEESYSNNPEVLDAIGYCDNRYGDGHVWHPEDYGRKEESYYVGLFYMTD